MISYTVDQLRSLWEQYHQSVHTHPYTPCDACPGDPCYVTSFLDWIEARERKKIETIKRVRPLGSE